GAELTSFRGNHTKMPEAASLGQDALVSGCVATPIPGWVEDMRAPVDARAIALAGAVAAKITRAPMDARPDGANGFDLRKASDLGGTPIGTARTFIGFDSSRVFTCFVVCATEIPSPSPPAGERAVAERPDLGCREA